MDNMNCRMLQIGVEAVVRTLLDAEEKYLAFPEAAPGEAYLLEKDMPAFDAQMLLQNLGNVIEGVSERDTQRYFVPGPGRIFNALRAERDKIVTTQGTTAENRIVACNRLMKALRARRQIY